MLRKLVLSSVIVSVVMLFSLQAYARQSVTCSGGHLYIEQTLPNGEEICWETNLTCKGEWTYSWLTKKKGDVTQKAPESANTRMAASADSEKQAATQALLGVKKSDLKLYYRAPSSVVQAFKERARWPKGDKGPIFLPPDSPGPTFPDPPPLLATAKGYPPHGYPCLGCKPCPPPEGAYCDIVWGKSAAGAKLTEKDLSPQFAAQGYIVKDGKIILKEQSKQIH